MAIWHIEWDPQQDLDLQGCNVISYWGRLGNKIAVVECDDSAVTAMRAQPGVIRVRTPLDGEAFVNDSCETIVIEHDGQTWRRL